MAGALFSRPGGHARDDAQLSQRHTAAFAHATSKTPMPTDAAPTYQLFHSPGACSLAPHIALELLGERCGVIWEPVRVVIADGANRKPEYLAINPRGRVPALSFRDADGREQILTESTAILLFLASRHPEAGLMASDPIAAIRTVEFLSWLATTMHQTGVRTVFRPERFTTSADKAAHAAIGEQGRITVRAGYVELDAKLAGRRFAIGDTFSVVDAMLVVHYRWGNRCGIDMRRDYPNFAALVDGLRAIPAVERVIAREGIQVD